MSHLRRSIEILGLHLCRDGFHTSGEILAQLDDLTGDESGESAVKRGLSTIEELTGAELMESAAGQGRRLRPLFRSNREWLYPLLTHFESNHSGIEMRFNRFIERFVAVL